MVQAKVQIGSTPVLSPKLFVGQPMRSSIDRYRLFSGVSFAGRRTCRPVLIVPPPLPDQQDRQVVVVVAVAVADAAAVDDHAVVEQRAVAFLDRLQLAEQVGELLDVEAVDLLDLRLLLRVVAVVRQVVVAFGDADERVGRGCCPRWRT